MDNDDLVIDDKTFLSLNQKQQNHIIYKNTILNNKISKDNRRTLKRHSILLKIGSGIIAFVSYFLFTKK